MIKQQLDNTYTNFSPLLTCFNLLLCEGFALFPQNMSSFLPHVLERTKIKGFYFTLKQKMLQRKGVISTNFIFYLGASTFLIVIVCLFHLFLSNESIINYRVGIGRPI